MPSWPRSGPPQIRRYLEQKLQQAALAAEGDSNGGNNATRRGKQSPLSVNQQLQGPVPAVQSLSRVALADLARMAVAQAEAGALPQQTAGRVKTLVGRLAGKEPGAPPGGGAASSSGSGRAYRWPPPAVPKHQHGWPQGQQPQLQQPEVSFEAANPAALTDFLEQQFLSRQQAAMEPVVSFCLVAPAAAIGHLLQSAAGLHLGLLLVFHVATVHSACDCCRWTHC